MASVNLGPAQVDLANLMSGRDASLVLTVTDSAGDAYTPSVATFYLYSSASLTPVETIVGTTATGTVTFDLADVVALAAGSAVYRYEVEADDASWLVGAVDLRAVNSGRGRSGARTTTALTITNGEATVGVTVSGLAGGGGGGGDGANLAYTSSSTTGIVTSDSGTDATIPAASGSVAGLLTAANFSKLAGIESGATADMTAGEILSALLTVDGAGSGLDADTLDGNSSAAFATTSALSTHESDTTSVHGITNTAALVLTDDSRLSDARTPTTHATTHQTGGSDAIKLDDLAAPDDTTDLDATTSAHGLLPKLGGGTTNFLRADGTWNAPSEGSGLSSAAPDALTGSPTLSFWYKADALALSNNDPVTSWTDSGPNSLAATQGTGSKQPIYKSAVARLGGAPAVLFDGTDDFLLKTSTGLTSHSTATAFAVTFGTNTSRSVFDARGSGFLGLLHNSTGPVWRTGSPTDVSSDSRTPLLGAMIVIGVDDGTDAILYVNGVAVASSARSANTTPSTITLGAIDGAGTASSYLTGHIAEVGLYQAALSAAQIRQLVNHLANKYGIGVAMP